MSPFIGPRVIRAAKGCGSRRSAKSSGMDSPGEIFLLQSQLGVFQLPGYNLCVALAGKAVWLAEDCKFYFAGRVYVLIWSGKTGFAVNCSGYGKAVQTCPKLV